MIGNGMFSSLLEDIRAHDEAWAPVLEAITVGDLQALNSAAVDPESGEVHQALVRYASFGVQNPWAQHLGDATADSLKPRMSILMFCFKSHQVDAARALLELPMPQVYVDDAQVEWVRRLSTVISSTGAMVEQDFAYQMATSKPEIAMPFLELVVEKYPTAPGLAKAAKVDNDVAARITVAQMNVRIRQAEGVDQVLATAAPTVNRRRAL